MLVMTELEWRLPRGSRPSDEGGGHGMDIITMQRTGGKRIVTGENSVLMTFAPTSRFRTRHGAGAALVDLAPDSAPWRHPVH